MTKPLDKLELALAREAVEDKAARAIAREDAPRYKYNRDGLTKRGREKWVESTLPGGPRAGIREAAEKCHTVDERINFFLELMSRGRFLTAIHTMTSQVWGVTRHVSINYATMAGRLLKANFDDKEELRARGLAFLEVIAEDALENGDRRSAVAAVRTFADIAGLVVKSVEHSGPQGGPIQFQDISRLSDAELEAAIVKAAANAIRAGGGPKDASSEAILARDNEMNEKKPNE